MHNLDEQQAWESYKRREYAALQPILAELGYSLAPEQPHISGERYLMQALTTESGRKLTLLGTRRRDGARVVIKATRERAGARELSRERSRRRALARIRFAYGVFHAPEEILFLRTRGFTIYIQSFIPQELPFLERPIQEQFDIALSAFRAQESARAATFGHYRSIKRVFGVMEAARYLTHFRSFIQTIRDELPNEHALAALLSETESRLRTNAVFIDQYGGFLTHSDFVPHNFRVADANIYLLDHSSIRFGNKHEGWARFANFMALHNPPLAVALEQYLRDNRAEEERSSFSLMRLYRLGELICYYANTIRRSAGDLRALNRARVSFWSAVLASAHRGEPVPERIRSGYVAQRDALRSEEEKRRQIGLH